MSETIKSAAEKTADAAKVATRHFDAQVKQIGGSLASVQSAAASGFEQTAHQAQASLHTGMERAISMTQEFAGLAQGHVQAMQESATIWAAGFQEMARSATEFAKASLDEATQVGRTIAASRSIKDAVELQGSYVRTAMEKSVAELQRATDATLKLAERASAPVAARVTMATDKLSQSFAQG